MLISFAALFISVLSSAVGLEHQFLPPNFVKPKRGITETDRNVPQGYKLHQFQPVGPSVRSIETNNPKSLPHYNNAKTVEESPLIEASNPSDFSDIFKPSLPYTNSPVSPHSFEPQSEQISPYSDNLFTISAGYKISGDNFAKPSKNAFKAVGDSFAKPLKAPVAGTNLQIPVYKTSYPLSKASESHIFSSTFQNKKAQLPIYQVQKSEELPPYLSSFQNQPLVLSSADHQFNFAARTPKVSNVQLGTPFLSPLSSFQGQVVPISTVANNPQFPQYKGATVEVYPTVGGFSTVAYQPLQTQPQLHFGHANVQHVQPVDNPRHSLSAEKIRTDVEIINKKKPTPPPKNDDDEDDVDDDEDYSPPEKQYRANSKDDDYYEPKPGKYFKVPPSEGNFKPSTSFPFKQYDEKFGKYSNRNRDGKADGAPPSKYHDYSLSNDDDDDEQSQSARYHSEDTSSKSLYSKQKDEEEDDDDRQGYERQKTEESSDDGPKYFNKDFDEELEASYGAELPVQKYVHVKEVPEVEYGSRSLKENRDNYESEEPSNQGSQNNFRYRKYSQGIQDGERYGSNIVTSLTPKAMFQGTFGYKIPRRNKAF